MSRVTGKGFSDLDLANAFTVGGLANARVSEAKVKNARVNDQLVTWKLGSKGIDYDDLLKPETEQLLAKYFPDVQPGAQSVGLRLSAPLRWMAETQRSRAIGRILQHPGYQAAANLSSDAAGFKSFVIDSSFLPRMPEYPGATSLTWPMRINAPQELADLLQRGSAAARGFIDISEPRPGLPSVSADIVEVDGDGFAGSYLALRFLPARANAAALPERFSLARLSRTEPLVLLPLTSGDAATVLTYFVYELAHNLPIDVAAWQAVRDHNLNVPPVVLAPPAFLRRARLSDIIPSLQARLGRLGPDSVLRISQDDLLRFNYREFQNLDLSRPTAGLVGDLLAKSNEFAWDRESDSAVGLLAIIRSVDARERGELQTGPAPAGDDGPSDRQRQGPHAQPQALPPSPPPAPDLVPPGAAPPSPPQERYTDVKVLDRNRPMSATEVLSVYASYTIEVAIRTKRQGLTAGRADQEPFVIKDQKAPADIWVVVTDETDRGSEPEGGAFSFDRHYAKLVLPVEGDSKDSARFAITPHAFAASGRGQIGIRLYHKLNLIDHLELDVYVSRLELHPADGRPAMNVTFKRPANDGGIEPPDEIRAARALTISISRKPGSALYRFAFVAAKDQSGEPCLVADKMLPETTLNDYVARFREILLKTVFRASLQAVDITKAQRDALINDLSQLGAEIVLKLFDYEASEGDLFSLGTMVKEALPDTSLIQIALSQNAEDFIFPWQILTLDPAAAATPANLWGYRFVIEVKRLRDGADPRSAEARNITSAKLRYARWNFINEPPHYTFLQEAVGKAREPVVLDMPVIESQDALIAALVAGGGDIIYVYAHGHAAAPSTPAGLAFNNKIRLQIESIAQDLKRDPLASAQQSAAWTDTYNLLLKTASDTSVSSLALKNSAEILLTDLLKQQFRLRDAPIVFLNTCESAQLWNALEGSFVGLFLKRGARAVVGTETTIPIVVADVFGRAVLEQLFAGETLGAAVKTARQALLDKKNNPLGLCYSVYGAADASLFPKPTTSEPGVIS